MKRIFRLGSVILVLFILCGLGYSRNNSGSSLRVYIKDEGFHEKNIVKPRIFVENIGDRRVTDFDLRYYFTVENDKKPVLERYYVPGSTLTLNRVNKREYCVCYQFRNVNVKPGDVYPSKDGNAIGIHYEDWSPMDKRNDYSNPGSPEWHATRKVDIMIIESREHSDHRHRHDGNDPRPPL